LLSSDWLVITRENRREKGGAFGELALRIFRVIFYVQNEVLVEIQKESIPWMQLSGTKNLSFK